jgi:hypothetical protein
MKERLAPFLMLLEARYAPLLFAVAPQAYAVYLWLMPQPYDGFGEFFAVMGGIGYEFIYVGAIAWAEEGKWSFWTWATAVIALLFSMAVAYYVYRAQGTWAWLHAGFPLVAFGYTMNMHAPAATVKPTVPTVKVTAVESEPDSAPQSKTAIVKVLAVKHGISESTAWRKVKAGELSLNGTKEH